MKYIIYGLFVAFLIVLFLFLKKALEPPKEPLYITGTDKCGECHSLEINGKQNKVWSESKHSKAHLSLLTDKAINFNKERNLEQPDKNKLCLKCHTTQFALNENVGPYYNIKEGIGCEGCHGAGSRYSPAEIMINEDLYIKNNGVKGDESTCRNCHAPKGNPEMKVAEDVCPFQQIDFYYKSAFDKIKHPVNRNNFK